MSSMDALPHWMKGDDDDGIDPEEHSLSVDSDGDIVAPLTTLSTVYRKLTESPIKCDEHAIEMVLGDDCYICPHCEKRYLLGVRGEKIVCRRDDIKKNHIHEVEVPSGWLEKPYTPDINEIGKGQKITTPNITWRGDKGSIVWNDSTVDGTELRSVNIKTDNNGKAFLEYGATDE